ncbi:cytochrome c oxidase subunit 1 [Ceratobasidium sp. 428]|nr:cytochrome c oxidase subunit 1 [Ceratobasidium sp. 428]
MFSLSFPLSSLFKSPSLNRPGPRGSANSAVSLALPEPTFWPDFSHYSGQESQLPCTKRALIVAIEYVSGQTYEDGESMRLQGCYEDANDMRELLIRHGGYSQKDIRILADVPSLDKSQQPTRDNIIEGLRWLTDGCAPGDRRFFHYAGHGTQTPDLSGDEKDGQDEAIQPADWATVYNREVKGLIIDDELRSRLVDPLPKDSTLTAVFDCCHSGTILDMDQETQAQSRCGSNGVSAARGRIIPPKLTLTLKWPKFRGSASCPVGNILELPELAKVKDPDEPASPGAECTPFVASEEATLEMMDVGNSTNSVYNAVEANVVCWSACLDEQLAWDCPGRASGQDAILCRRGVLTAAFTAGIRGAAANYNAMPGGFNTEQRDATYAELYDYVVEQEKQAYIQRISCDIRMARFYQHPQLWISVAMGKIMDRPVEL